MGVSLCFTTSATYTLPSFSSSYNRSPSLSQTLFFPFCPKPLFSLNLMSKSKCGNVDDHTLTSSLFDYHRFDHQLLQSIAYDSLVWASLHGLLVGHKSIQNSGTVPGVGLVHAPFALLPNPFPEIHWKQACHLAPLFNELVDRVSLDGKFLQESLSRTKKVDEFTSRLLDIHSKMLEINKKEDIRLGLHRSDYMLDEQTNSLLQIELNTISSSFAGLSSLVSKLHRNTLSHYGKLLELDSERVPANNSVNLFVEALAKAWSEYNNPRAVIMFIVQAVERNMYDQHFLSVYLRERHHITTIRKTLAEVDQEGELLPDGTLAVGGQAIAVIYFRAGYTPADFPSESEWRARLLMEQSSAIKCPSISYHLVGTKKIQQELAKPNVLERFLENKDDIAKLRECFAGLWSLDDSDIARKAIERPELYVMKPQREGGGNNIYGDAVRETLQKLQKAGSQEDAAYILMQRIFPTTSAAILMRDGCWHKDHAISELGIYGTYLRNKDKVIMNNQSGYLMRTKVSSSDEGGVAAGFAVLDSVYLT
ncbi:glutathione synthetase, chloroplastic [Arachis hypogaea]|uniref:glutathione synthetase, chloroplastic n=1 Tax=Arachis hypogaea TaxID=3818 RepID=UPI000DECBBB8|nr:glutathione synthetase, chloroplastic [Arachis hypogaea]QHO45459.1 Glutathione synthetase [Arachis hypogaea]